MGAEVPYGALELLILKLLQRSGPLHGFGIAREIERLAEASAPITQGSVYPALVRLQQRRWVAGRWGTSDKGRRARFYQITPKGERQLAAQAADWFRMVAMMRRVLEA